jgi:DMSO/TMAO reductase YedYZ molybdopterin-dependent catalytic subunit
MYFLQNSWPRCPALSMKVTDHSGSESLFDGIPARELLRLTGAPLGKGLSGKNLSLYVVAEAADGYAAVYALAEFDSAFTDAFILIANRRNGKALSADEGPLRVVVPWEKRQARWVRQLIVLRLARAP